MVVPEDVGELDAPSPAVGAKWRPPLPNPRPFELNWGSDWLDAGWQRAIQAADAPTRHVGPAAGLVGRAARYLRALAACKTPADLVAVADTDPAIDGAYALRRSADKIARGVVEARLLANQTTADVAAACALPAEVVEAYAALFFDLDDGKRDCQFYIIHQAIGTKFWSGMTEADLDVVLRSIGYFHGPLLLDVAIRACTTGWRVPDRLDGLTVAELRDLLSLIDAKYFVKLSTTPAIHLEQLLPLALLRADLRGLIAERSVERGAGGEVADSPTDWSVRATAWCKAARVAAA